MEIEPVTVNGTPVAVVSGEGKLITDAQSALELAMSVKYASGADRFAISKKQVCGEFFVLSTGIAGEILQKLCNYRGKSPFSAISRTIQASPCEISSTSQITATTSFSPPPRKKPCKS